MEQNTNLLDRLLNDSRFVSWVREGQHESYWNAWIKEHPDDLETLKDARAIVRGLPVRISQIDDEEIEYSFEALQQKLGTTENRQTILMRPYFKYAAAVILLLLGSLWWYHIQTAGSNPDPLLVHTLPGELKKVDLPDSSHVVLNGNSTLEYIQNENERSVQLQGEAHFDVHKMTDESQPQRFVVHTLDLDIEVLGTVFSVRKDSIWTTIVLEEGKVSLLGKSSQSASPVFIMTPGDKVIYNSTDGSFTQRSVDAVSYNSWTSNHLSLVNRSVEEVTRLFSNNYDIHIQIPKTYRDRELTGSVDLSDTETAIKMIGFALGLNPVKVNEKNWDFK